MARGDWYERKARPAKYERHKTTSCAEIRYTLADIARNAGRDGFWAADACKRLPNAHVQTVRGELSRLVHDGKLRVEEGHKNETGHAIKKYFEVVEITGIPPGRRYPMSDLQRVALGSLVA